MYSSAELNEVMRRKVLLRGRIASERSRCATLASDAARPLRWLDGAIEKWRRIPPVAKIAALPLGMLFSHAAFPGRRVKLAGKAMRLLPIVLGAIKLWKTPPSR